MKGVFQIVVLASLVTAVSLLGCSSVVHAAQFRSGDKVTVEAGEIVGEDLYVIGGEVVVDGTVQGDLVVLAGQVTVNGLVIGDLIAGGGTVLLNGAVGDDIRMAGGVLKLGSGAEVADDVVAAGISAEAANDGTVDGSVYYAGYQSRFAGSIGENLTAAMARCELSGAVQGDVLLGLDPDKNLSWLLALLPSLPVPMPEISAGLTVAPSAKIDGALAYRSPVEGNIDKEADIAGGVDYVPHSLLSSSSAETSNMDKAFALIRHFATLAIIGLCVLVILPRWSQGLAESVRTRPLASVGSGLLGIVFVAILLLVLLVLIFGLMFAIGQLDLTELAPVVWTVGALSVIGVVGGFWFFTSYVAQIVVSLALGRFMLFAGRTNRRILPFLAGLIVLVVLMNLHRVTNLPYAGQIVEAVVVVVGVGGWVLWTIGSWRRRADG